MLRTVTSFPTRLCLAAAVLVCAASAFALAPPRADAANAAHAAHAAECGVLRLCLFSGPHFTGRMSYLTESDLDDGNLEPVPSRVKGRVSSWINETSLTMCGFRHVDEVLWRGSAFTRDEYVGDEDNNETDAIKADC
jgi:hypothetical protein